MKITLKFVLDLFKDVVKTYNINKNDLNTVFDWIDIVKTNTIKPESEPKKILFCAVYEEQPEKDGWYELGFDKRIKILEVWRKSPNTIFLVDRTLNNTLELKTIGVKIVEIPDIFDGCEIIFRKILEITQPLVIGVTGSVGKTTTVALLEDIFLTEGKVLRIYSKRLITSSFGKNFKTMSLVFSLTLSMLFIMRGMNLGIPYLSPKLAENSTLNCCHKK